MRTRIALVLSVAAVLTLYAGCEKLKPIGQRGTRSQATTSTGSSSTVPEKDRVKVAMYVMSKCPYGVQAEQGIEPALAEIGQYVDYQVDFIANEANGEFQSLHGEPEVKGNIQQLCVMKHYPEQARWRAFLACVNENWQQIPEGWDKCAEKNNMDVGQLRSCIEGNQGKDLLRESLKRAQQANAQGSPTITVGGEEYQGGREKNDFIRAICGKLTGSKPSACANIPEDVEVTVTVLTDKRCAECQTSGLEQNLRSRFFPKLKVKSLDYADEEGKALYKELGLKLLPVMLFTAEVEKAERYSQIARWMEEKGKYKQLRIPAQFDPTAEICDNKIDDTGDGKIDCADSTCTASLVCRPEKKKTLDVFIMSQCPYGVQAVNAMKEVLGVMKSELTFDVHFIADQTDSGFSSMHGQAEVDEDIRMLCVKKLYPKNYKWLDYYWCRFTGDDWKGEDWKKCATGDFKADAIEKCATGDEGKKLLGEDVKVAKSLDISGSPTWLANNKVKFHGIAADAIKTNICQQNAGMTGCDKKLSAEVQASGSCGN